MVQPGCTDAGSSFALYNKAIGVPEITLTLKGIGEKAELDFEMVCVLSLSPMGRGLG